MTREEILSVAKPILFNTDMVRAILVGRKSETRRAVKPQPPQGAHIRCRNSVWGWFWWVDVKPRPIRAPYKVDDYLYVRETWSTQQSNACIGNTTGRCPYDSCETASGSCFGDEYIYKATDRLDSTVRKWHPSIHMPKEAARIFLRVVDVRVEQLRDIGNCTKEGISPGTHATAHMNDYDERCDFAALWDSIIPKKDLDKYGWNANPWVWVIQFERVEV